MGRKSSRKRVLAVSRQVGSSTDQRFKTAVSWTSVDLYWGLLILGCVLLVYIPALAGEFIWDDDVYIINSDVLRDLDGLRRIWLEPTSTPQYYPLVHTLFWLEYQIWGLVPLGYHLVNVVFHGISAFVLWRVLLRLGVPGAWLAAAVFALHPVHVESVAWITERKNVLSGFFYLWAAWAYLRFLSINGSDAGNFRANSVRYYRLTWLAFIAALLSKTVTASLPVALLLITWWKRRSIQWCDVVYLGPMLAVGMVMGLTTAYLEKVHVGAQGVDWSLSFVERFLVAGRALWFYTGKLLWPVQLTFIYPRWQVSDVVWWQYLFPLAAVIVIVSLIAFRARLGRAPLVAVLFFVVTLFPALGFVDVYPFRYSFVADHFQYLGSLGIIVLGVGVVTNFVSRWAVGARTGIALLVLCVISALTWHQAKVYTSLESLWQDTIAKDPSSWMAHNNLAGLRMDAGRLDEAIKYYERTAELKPDHPNAPNNIGQIHLLRDEIDEAERWLVRAVQVDSDFAPPHVNLGLVYSKQGRSELAEEHFREAIAIRAGYHLAHYQLGLYLMRAGRIDEAVRSFETAVTLNRIDPIYRTQLAIAMTRMGEGEQALEHFRAAVQRAPDDFAMHYNLALALRNFGLTEESIVVFETALQIEPTKVEVRMALAETHATSGDFDKAIEIATSALDLAKQAGQTELVVNIQQRLDIYERRRGL
jgi:tetratricopeptide (TPR) repeat protein